MLSINPLQRRVLAMLSRVNFACTTDISSEMNTTKQTARSQTRALVDKGYAERVPKSEVDKLSGASEYTRITELGKEALTYDFTLKKERATKPADPAKVFVYTPYIPPPMQSVRPGADDHLQFKSRGF